MAVKAEAKDTAITPEPGDMQPQQRQTRRLARFMAEIRLTAIDMWEAAQFWKPIPGDESPRIISVGSDFGADLVNSQLDAGNPRRNQSQS